MLYSLLYDHANSVALSPLSTTETSTSSNSASVVTTAPAVVSTPGTTGAASVTTTTPAAATTASGGTYRDGTYTGSVADAQWGYIQVKVVIKNGKITDVPFLQAPNDRNRSVDINSYADPQLASEAIQAQSANVDIVTGATDSSEAFMQSLSDALTKAKA